MAVGAQGVLRHEVQVVTHKVKDLLVPEPASRLTVASRGDGSKTSKWPRSSKAATSSLSVFQSFPIKTTRLVVVNCRGMLLCPKVGAAVCQDTVFARSVWPKALSR